MTSANLTLVLNMYRLFLIYLETGKIAQGYQVAKGTKLHENKFAPRVNFAQMDIFTQ